MNQTASTMQGQNPLDALEPNILPPAIGTWPPAIGWWLLAVVTIVLLAVLLWWLWRWYQKHAYRRHGLRKLRLIKESYQQHNDRQRFLQECNHLLKGVALQAYPRQDSAALSGQQWQTFLNRTVDKAGLSKLFTEGGGRYLGIGRYEKSSDIEPDKLYRVVETWIKKHRTLQQTEKVRRND